MKIAIYRSLRTILLLSCIYSLVNPLTLLTQEEQSSQLMLHIQPAARQAFEEFTFPHFTISSYVVSLAELSPLPAAANADEELVYVLELGQLRLRGTQTQELKLELGNAPFNAEHFILTRKFTSNTTSIFTNNTAGSLVAATEPLHIRTYYYFAGNMAIDAAAMESPNVKNQSTALRQLTFPSWELFVLAGDVVTPVTFAAKTVNLPPQAVPKLSFVKRLSTDPAFAVQVVIIGLGCLLSLGYGLWLLRGLSKRRRAAYKLEQSLWKRCAMLYAQTGIAELYFQASKKSYFKALSNCLSTAMQEQTQIQTLPPPLSHTLTTYRKKLAVIIAQLTENNQNTADIAEAGYSWVQSVLLPKWTQKNKY